MQFYTKTHAHYCGIDLHTKMMYVCILNNSGDIVLHQNIPTDPIKFLKLIAPFQEDLVIGVECIFSATAPALLYLLHPCSRPGTGWPMNMSARGWPLFWAMRCI